MTGSSYTLTLWDLSYNIRTWFHFLRLFNTELSLYIFLFTLLSSMTKSNTALSQEKLLGTRHK